MWRLRGGVIFTSTVGMGSLTEVLKEIRDPSAVESFVYTIQPVITVVSTDKDLEDNIMLKNITPFHTFEEVLRELWLETGKHKELFPTRVFFAEKKGELFYPVLYDFLDGNKNEIGFSNPEEIFSSGDAPELTNTTRTSNRSAILLEKRYPNWEEETPDFYVFSYEVLRQKYLSSSGRTVDAVWNQLFLPFFGEGNDSSFRAEIPADKMATAEASAIKKRENVVLLKTLLEKDTASSATIVSTKLLKLVWKKRVPDFDGVGILFFQAPVTPKRPYMRYIPIRGTPLTKLYQENPAELPLVHDPKLLKGWTEVVAPISGKEFLITKPLLREEAPLTTPLFGTFYAMDDATALFTIQPPKGVRFLSFDTDTPLLMDTETFASEAFGDMSPFDTTAVDIGMYTCVMRFEFDTPPSSGGRNFTKVLAERLGQLSTLFRQSGVVETDISKPFLALRYRAVSNYKSESELYAYIQLLIENLLSENPEQRELSLEQKTQIALQLREAFDISAEQATRALDLYQTEGAKLVVANAQQEEFIPSIELGITLLFKGYSPKIFDVYCYNINSLQTLQRISTILTKAFYLKDEEWREAVQTAVTETHGEEEESEYEEEEAEEEEEEEEAEEDEAEEDEAEEDEAEAEEKLKPTLKARDEVIDPRSWYLNRLYALDKVLFKPEKEAGKPAFSYVEKCQANYDRQPAGLTHSEFMAVWNEYTNSTREIKKLPCNQYVKIIVYGDPNTREMLEDAKGARERITFVKYGSSSDPKKANYYTCSRLFCLRDVMPILEADYVSELRADGKTKKPKNSCPFCGGETIKNRDIAGVANQTVLERRPKPSKPQTATGFLRSAGHPKGYEVPCCGVKQTDILWEDPKFAKYRGTSKLPKLSRPAKTAVEEAKEEADEEANQEEREEVEDLRRRATGKTNFSMIRFSLNKQYVKGANIYPLDEGTIGCPQLALDELFGQTSSEMITRTVVRQEFRPEAKGLFRIGVQNKPYALHNSFFSAIAPMLGYDTADEVAEFFDLRIQPLIFLNLNFGNLVMEFYDPSDTMNNGSDDDVNAWGQKIFIKNPIESTAELHRFYNSYRRFKDYILGVNSFEGKPKQMRHFVHALSEPGLILSEGLTLMILYYVGDPRSNEVEVNIKCPVMGLDITRYANNQIGFLTYSDLGMWEPMIYVDQIQRKGTSVDIQEGYYTVDKELLAQDTFPDAIKQQYQQFVSQCKSAYRGAFTYQSQIDNRILLPVSKVLAILSKPTDVKPSGLVRDSYNHLVAITVNVKGTDRQVLVPVVDDGNSFHTVTNVKMYLSIAAVEKAYAYEVYSTYKILTAHLSKYNKMYELQNFLQKGDEAFAFQIGGTFVSSDETSEAPLKLPTLLLPCEPTSVEELQSVLPEGRDDMIVSIGPKDFQFEYEINRSILFGNPAKKITSKAQLNVNDYLAYSKTSILEPSVKFLVTQKQVDNIYEHLRLTFSKYINEAKHQELKQMLEERILENRRIPDFEKIKRLDILLRSTIRSWLAPEPSKSQQDSIFIRRDCLHVSEEKCDGYCTFTAEGQCKIHIPTEIAIEPEKDIPNAADYFCDRLFVELARLPAKRIEMMNNMVKRIQVPRTNVHVDKQWILPENVPAWDKLLLESSQIFTDTPHFYEEFSRSTESERELEQIAEMDRLVFYTKLPEELQSLALFTEEGKENVVAKTLEGADPVEDILDYFGLEDYKRQRKAKADGLPEQYFSRPEFLDLCNVLKSPIIQIYRDEEGVLKMCVYKTRTTPTTASTYIFIPNVLVDPEDEQPIAAIYITKDQLNPTIPLSYLLPEVSFEMVRILKKLKRNGPKPLPPPVAAAEES